MTDDRLREARFGAPGQEWAEAAVRGVLPGFNGYSVIDAGNGVMTSVGFHTAAQADESTSVAGSWLREQKLETAHPNPPKLTSGDVVVHKTREPVQA